MYYEQEGYEYLTNVSAAALLSGHLDEGAMLLEKSKVFFVSYRNAQDSNSYEVLYNYGTLLLYLDRLDEAETTLTQALHLGRRQLREGGELEVDVEEDSSDEPELDPIRIQLAFIKIRRGHNAEAEKEILSVLSHHGISKVIASIATCNLAACRGSKEAADSLRRYDES